MASRQGSDVMRRGAAAVASAAPDPWYLRTDEPGRFALSLGLLTAATLLAALVLAQLALGRIPFTERGEPNNLRVAAVHCLLVAYLPAAYLYLRAMVRRTLLALRPALDMDSAAFETALAAGGTMSRAQLALAALIGLGIASVGPYVSGGAPVQPWNPATWTPEVAWHRLLGPVIGVWIGWFSLSVFRESRRLSRLAGALPPLDVLDLGALAPFTRQALVHALLTMGLLAIFGLFVVDQGVTPLIAAVTPLTVALALGSLLIPLRGVRDRIRAAKLAELGRVDRMIRSQAGALLGPATDAVPGRLADLLAYRQMVERVREWPFDQSALFRVAVYMLIPLASWLASGLLGAVLERWLFAD